MLAFQQVSGPVRQLLVAVLLQSVLVKVQPLASRSQGCTRLLFMVVLEEQALLDWSMTLPHQQLLLLALLQSACVQPPVLASTLHFIH